MGAVTSRIISIAELETFSELVLRTASFRFPFVLVITEFISNSMAVLLNVLFMCVGIQCYDKYVCVCVESDLLDVFFLHISTLKSVKNTFTSSPSLKIPESNYANFIHF